MFFENPKSNIAAELSENEQAFHIETFDFDVSQFPALAGAGPEYSAGNVRAFIGEVQNNPGKHAKGIDMLEGNEVRSQLKCKSPCFTCSDTDPSNCISCWGAGE
jgi:hypothetical protein